MTTAQLGFDLVYTDALTQEVVPWALPEEMLLRRLKAAPWKVLDVETTGLNPSSKEQTFSGRDLRRGVSPELRLRVLTALIPSVYALKEPFEVVAFDFDQLTPEERTRVCEASFSEVVIGHNVGFDAYWILGHTSNRPRLLLDTMLLARILRPQHPVHLAHMCANENEDEALRREAEAVFLQGRSGWSLADLSLGVLRKILPKTRQGPKNWCEPFLTQESYDYATGDGRTTFELLLNLLELSPEEVGASPGILVERYMELRQHSRTLRLVEPQVADIVEMRLCGMPWDLDTADSYVRAQWAKVRDCARRMVEIEPALKRFEADMGNAEKGVSAELKSAIGAAFVNRGLELALTEKTGAFKVGEKDLRQVRAQVSEVAKELFDTWVALNRAKKAGGMAKEVSGFARRSKSGRLHPNTSHGPVTGRLASSEPNCQQFPRDQGFRNCVKAKPGYLIGAFDYSALDMRVGAALAIRAQTQILEAYMGDRAVAPEVQRIIQRVYEGQTSVESARTEEARATKAFADWKAKRDDVSDSGDARKKYWNEYRRRAHAQLLTGFGRCLAQVKQRADAESCATWGSLRDAFSIKGMDIHTWTTLGMLGKDPKTLFEGLSGSGVAKELKNWKKELGDLRQTGKVGNLSLLYAMKTLGLVEAAAKNYNIHWMFEEADKIRYAWLDTYVEIDLWHKWTELNALETVYVPDADRGGRYGKKQVFASYTLSGRLVYAFGLNAALSYEDQSTGADILGLVMQTLRERHPDVFGCAINQVHDELVFEIPAVHIEGYAELIEKVMTESAEHFLLPFGVRGECGPAIGPVWVKD